MCKHTVLSTKEEGNTLATPINVISIIKSENNRIPLVSLLHCFFYYSLNLTVCIGPNLALSLSNMLKTVATKSTHRLGASVDYLPVILVCFTLCCVTYLRVIAIGVYKL